MGDEEGQELKKEQITGKIINRIAWGILAGSIYVFAGNVYTCNRIAINNAEVGTGHNNRIMNEEFYDEFTKETNNLEFDLEERVQHATTVVPLAVYVHTGVKAYFDDANNPDDNNVWAKEVETALSGLDMYKELGIEFDVVSVETTEMVRDFASSSYSMARLNMTDYKFGTIAVAFYPLPGLEIEETVLGYGYIGGDYCEIYLSNNETYNKLITAHEIAHIFGVGHDDEIDKWNMIFDPFEILSMHLMRPLIGFQNFSLRDKDGEIISKAKERFEGYCHVPVEGQ